MATTILGRDKQLGFREKKGRENWASDNSVTVCKCGQRFTAIKRRHHCRSCGGVFCDACTNYQALVPTGEGGTQGGTKRVCLPCYNVLKQTQSVGGSAEGQDAADLQFVKVAIGKIRQEDEVLLQRLRDRVEVLSTGLGKIFDDIQDTQQRIADGASLFTGTTHDIISDQLHDLACAYERRQQRAEELKRALRYHSLTAFFTVVQAKLLEVLLHFVLAATTNDSSTACMVRILGTDFRVASRNLSTHFLRQCGEGASVRDLCEVMQDVAEDAALRVTFRHEEQVSCLTCESAKAFGECLVGRLISFFKRDVVSSVQSRMPPSDLLVDAVDEFPNCASDTPIPLDTRDTERDSGWTDTDLLACAAIRTSSGEHWNKAEEHDPHKYYYMIGTSMEARKKGYTPTGSNRNCKYPVFDLSRAREEQRKMIRQRGQILESYYLSGVCENEVETPSHGMPEAEEAEVLLTSLHKLKDHLRDPVAYGHQLLTNAVAAQAALDELARKERVLVDHSQDLRDAPEALSQQASYIRLQHEFQAKALSEFVDLMRNGAVLQHYAHLRLKLLQQLVAHRAYAVEAITAWPDMVVGGVDSPFSDQVLHAVDSAIASDRTGVRASVLLLDEKSHIIPRWSSERFAEQLQRMAPEGIHVFSDCFLLRLLHCLPQPGHEDGSPARALGQLGTGTLSAAAKERRALRCHAPISTETCMQIASVPLEQTLLGKRHVILPTADPDANWKESSVHTKCGIATLTEKARGAGKHGKPQKYGYAKGGSEEAQAIKHNQFSQPPVRQGFRAHAKSRLGWASPRGQNDRLADRPLSEQFPRGCEVEAHSLQSAADLNGQVGVVQGVETEPPNEGRLQVRFRAPHGDKALKPQNLLRRFRLDEFAVGQEVETRGTSDQTRGVVTAVDGGNVSFRTVGTGQTASFSPELLSVVSVPKEAPRSPSPSVEPADLPSRGVLEKDRSISFPKSTLVCTPRVVTAGQTINCVLVLKDEYGKKSGDVTASELEVFPFGHCGMLVESEPHPATDDGATFQFTVQLSAVGSFPVGLACRGKVKVSNSVTVVAGPVDWLASSRLAISPETTFAGEHMHGRVELRDSLGNLATSAGLEDFTVSVTNLVELATTKLRQADDGAFVFSFIPTEEGEVEVEVGFCGLLKQCTGYHECRPGPTDFKNTLVVLDKCEAEVGDIASGVLVLRDIYGNRALNVQHEDTQLCLKAGDEDTAVPLIPVPGEVSEYTFEFKCTRRGLVLLETKSAKTKERVITKVSVSMPLAAIDWARTTVSLVPRDVVAGGTVTCTILARDVYGNLLQELDADGILLQILSDPPPEFEIKHGPPVSRGGTVTCCFEPLAAGSVWTVARMGDDSKQSNSVTVSAGPLAWDASTVTLREEALVGDSVPVHITARDKYGNPSPTAHSADFQVTVWNEDQRLDHSKVQGESGKFFFSFEPQSTGHAWVEVFYSGRSKESTRCVISPGKVDWAHCKVVLDRDRIKAGEVLRCDLTLCDKCGNETANEVFSPADFLHTVCDAVSGEACAQAAADATPIDGVGAQFWFQFSPTTVGDVMARISLRGDNNDSTPAAVAPEAVCWERSTLRFASAETTAGCTLQGEVLARDRFGNPTEVLRYAASDSFACTALKDTDMSICCRNYAETDHEVLDVTMRPSDIYGTYSFAVTPKMLGEIRGCATLGSSVELAAQCTVGGGGLDWPSCSVSLNPSELQAGEEAVCTIDLRDRFGNSTGGSAQAHEFITSIWNERVDVRLSDVVATGDATFAFTAEPTRAGQAYASVSYEDVPKESNMVYVKPAEMSFINSTLDWAVLKVFAGDHLEGTLTFRDRFGNPTSALAPNEVELVLDNEGCAVKAFLIDDYVSVTETTQMRFYCEPTKSGAIGITAVRKETGETIKGRDAVVKPGAVDWSQSTTEIPSLRSADQHRVAQAGDTVTGVITCRDKFQNLACPGSTSAFTLTIKANGQLVVAPTPYVPGLQLQRDKDGGVSRTATEEASVFHFDLVPRVAGPTEIESRFNPQPLEAPHKLQIEVRSGAIDWRNKCTVTVQEREVVAGEVLHFTLSIRDTHGNPTGGAVASMFLARLENEGAKVETSAVLKDKDSEVFTFTGVPTRSGDARALVVHKGEAIHSPSVRVVPGPLYFPACQVTTPDQAAAGVSTQATLSLKDKYGNPTPLGAYATRDFVWGISNTGTPSEGSPKPQTKEITPSEPLAPGGSLLGGKATDLHLKFEPHWKGSMTVTCTCPKDTTNHKFTKNIAVTGGAPDVRSSTIKVRPDVVKAGDPATVEVLVRDGHKNPTPFDIKQFVCSTSNERESPAPTPMQEVHGGFTFTFIPTRQGKARAKVKHKSGKDTVESPVITVLSADLHIPTSSVKVEPSSVSAGTLCTATIQLRDKYKNVLSADPQNIETLLKQITPVVKNGHAKIIPSELKLKGNLLSVEFEPRERGVASITVSMKSASKDSVVSNDIDVKPGPVDFEHCSIGLDADTVPVNTPVSLVLTMKDKFHNITTGARAEHFSVRVINEAAELNAPRLMGKDKSSTAFAAQVIPIEVGRCCCEVTFHPPNGEEPVTRKSNDILVTS